MGEKDTYVRELRWILSEVASCLDAMPAEARTWRPLPTANDAATIARHVLGATRAYAVGIGGVTPVERDRPAEFRSNAEDERLPERIEQLRVEVLDVLTGTADADLDLPATALAPWEGREPPTGTRRDVIVEAIRHAGVHLGELRLTRDLAIATRSDDA